MEVFQDYAYYYNAFYRDKDYGAEAADIDRLLKRYGQKIKDIINFGCGTGRHDIELSKMGYQCTGIDISPLMIDIAEKNSTRYGCPAEFEVADIRNYHPRTAYDAVISLFHVMSYQKNNDDILAAFASARKALKAGGVFVFDTWYGPGVLSDKPSVKVKESEDENNRLIRIARPIMRDKYNVVDVCYEVFIIEKETGKTKVINEVHNMRYFFRPEIEFLLKETGFALVGHLDCKTLKETSYNSWTSYFIANAI